MEGQIIPLVIELVIVFVIGAAAGSFANVVALAYPDFRKILVGRSACPTCHKPLSWYELIPMVSYVLQTGKCRSCRKKIAPSYFWVELSTGILFVTSYFVLQPGLLWWQVLLTLLILISWVVIFLHDARSMYVPMVPLWVGVLFTLLLLTTQGNAILLNGLVAGALGFAFIAMLRFGASYLLKQEAMGSADAYVALLVGLLVGFPEIILALFASFLIGTIYGLVMTYQSGKKSLQAKVPFAPALLLGGLLCIYYGQQIVHWYLGNL